MVFLGRTDRAARLYRILCNYAIQIPKVDGVIPSISRIPARLLTEFQRQSASFESGTNVPVVVVFTVEAV